MFRRNKYIFSYQKKRQAATIKKILTIIFSVLAVIVAVFVGFAIYNSKIHIDLLKDRQVQVNTPATANQFIEGIGNGRLVEDVDIDTSSVGTKDCNVKIKVGEEIRDYSFTVDVIDTQAPIINLSETKVNVLSGTPLDYLPKADVTDNSNEEIPIKVEGEYNPNTLGPQVVSVVATDSSGNSAKQDITINVIGLTKEMPDTDFLTTTGHKAELKNGMLYVDGILVVNKSFGLASDYAPGLDGETLEAFIKMANAAWNDGLYLEIVTDFRTYREQELLFEYWAYVANEGEDTMSAVKAGFSEHQTGLALDINSTQATFAGTVEALWLEQNCHKYGFILRYPEDKVDVTGCSWEPWHVRYVGTDLSSKLYKDGKWTTLEEYFGIPSHYLK